MQVDSSPAEPQGEPKNTGVGSLSLLQQICLTQELNWGLLHCRWILYQLSYQGRSIPEKVSTKECTSHWIIALISHASKVMFKILHARPQCYENQGLPDVQTGFRKGRGTRDQIANSYWILEKAREFQKNIYVSLTTLKPLTVYHDKLWIALG